MLSTRARRGPEDGISLFESLVTLCIVGALSAGLATFATRLSRAALANHPPNGPACPTPRCAPAGAGLSCACGTRTWQVAL